VATERTTQQKRALLNAFELNERPLTVSELQEIAGKECPGIGVATVYRTVNRLLESEWLKEVCLPGQAVRYERRALEHHHHFHCNLCSRVLDVAAPCERLSTEVPDGFQVERHELTFYGVCADCAAMVD
jgi:Fur family ferric uptake transcriptional regulator